jgi:hypothetical protein
MMPMIDFSVVVLPAPLRPSKRDDLALGDVEIDAVQDVGFSVPGVEVAHFEHRGGGGGARHVRCLSHARSDIGFDHARILRDGRVVALGENLAAGQHGDAVRQRRDDREIVLHHQDGAVGRDAADELGDAVDVLVAHAGHRLVQQHHLGSSARVVAISSARLRP